MMYVYNDMKHGKCKWMPNTTGINVILTSQHFSFLQIKAVERYTMYVTTLEKCVYFGAHRCVIKVQNVP